MFLLTLCQDSEQLAFIMILTSGTVEPVTNVPLEVNKIFIAPNVDKLMQNYNALHDLPTAQTDKAKLSLQNVSPTYIPQLEQNLMSLPELTPDKVTKLQKSLYILKKKKKTYYNTYIAVNVTTSQMSQASYIK